MKRHIGDLFLQCEIYLDYPVLTLGLIEKLDIKTERINKPVDKLPRHKNPSDVQKHGETTIDWYPLWVGAVVNPSELKGYHVFQYYKPLQGKTPCVLVSENDLVEENPRRSLKDLCEKYGIKG